MLCFTEKQLTNLKENGNAKNKGKNNIPHAYLSLMGTNFQWLVSEISHENTNKGFGLIFRENKLDIGEIDLDELSILRGPDCFDIFKNKTLLFTEKELRSPSINNDFEFKGTFPLSVYAQFAKECGQIFIDHSIFPKTWQKYLTNSAQFNNIQAVKLELNL